MKNNKPKKRTSNNDDEPIIDQSAYSISLASALNYYNEMFQLSEYKSSVLDFAKSISKDIPTGVPEFEFRSIGAICRLILREQYISIPHMNYVLAKIDTFKSIKEEKEKSKPIEVKAPVENTILLTFLAKLEDMVDEYVWDNKSKEIGDLKKEYNYQIFTKSDHKKIITWCENNIKQYNIIYNTFNDEDIKEAYRGVTKTKIKSIVTQLETFKSEISVIEKISVSSSRPKKDKPPMIQVSNIPYLKTFESLNGLHPKEVIGKTVAYIYDTVTRELIYIQSMNGKLKASGQSFINMDDTNSFKKKIRKPEEFFIDFFGESCKTKLESKAMYDSIKTTAQKGVGRMNENKIILKVY
jgi:hypothetical protein